MDQNKRLILTTAGSSLLLNQVDRAREEAWATALREMAHVGEDDLQSGQIEMLNTLKQRALQKLNEADVDALRRMAAELNALVSLYDGRLKHPDNKQDHHIIIATDTAIGRATAEILHDFLCRNGYTADCTPIESLDTRDTATYRKGVHNLLERIEETVPGYRESGYRVIFNLSGGFKSLSGYLTGIGTIYADEMVYIFDEKGSSLVRIPPLPVKLDDDLGRKHFGSLAILAEERYLPGDALPDLPPPLVERDADLCMMSLWGKILWNRLDPDGMYAGQLYEYAGIVYEASFEKDWKACDRPARVSIQKAIVGAAALFLEGGLNIAPLKRDPGLQYEDYKQRPGIGHFRAGLQWRISCRVEDGRLILRRCGTHDHVERAEKV